MEFVQHHYKPGETIAAIATPPGEGGVAIIRISGNQALDIAETVFSKPIRHLATHTAHFGHIRNHEGRRIDDVLLLLMLGQRSFTGEDTVEVHCHGGSMMTRRVLEVIIQAGARAALPGEFSFKSFINGKIDLSQAEAIQELICAKNDRALDAATQQLQGALSKKIMGFQQQLTTIAAILEAWVDFPEEGLEFATMEEICDELKATISDMLKLADTFHDGRLLKEGISLCLIGSPNVGKSSLMNALLDKERAIVSQTPGTTRDILEDHVRFNGVNLRLIDTAGIRDSDEAIEQEGIRRTRETMKQADLILLVFDATQELTTSDQELLQQVPKKKTLLVWNKIDLPYQKLPELDFPHQVTISAKHKQGIDDLKAKVDKIIWEDGPPLHDEILITNLRHKENLQEAIMASQRVVDGLKGDISPEFLSIDMRQCLGALGKIIGVNITEDILSAIFSKFCIGK